MLSTVNCKLYSKGLGSGGLGRAGAPLACGQRVPVAAAGGEAGAEFAAHSGGQRCKLVLDQDRAVGLVPRGNLILRLEIAVPLPPEDSWVAPGA